MMFTKTNNILSSKLSIFRTNESLFHVEKDKQREKERSKEKEKEKERSVK